VEDEKAADTINNYNISENEISCKFVCFHVRNLCLSKSFSNDERSSFYDPSSADIIILPFRYYGFSSSLLLRGRRFALGILLALVSVDIFFGDSSQLQRLTSVFYISTVSFSWIFRLDKSCSFPVNFIQNFLQLPELMKHLIVFVL
jgi:hypothetical protein